MNKESLYKLTKMENVDKVVVIIENKASFPLSMFGSVVSKLNRLGVSVLVINDQYNIVLYPSKGINTYDKYLEESLIKYDLSLKINEIQLLVEDKIKTDLLCYDKLLEFLDTL